MGIARGTLDAFVELARDKIPRGAKRSLRDNNVVQSQVAQSRGAARAARAFLWVRSKTSPARSSAPAV